jgi:[ribosomal protein S5]-alanine N-acetyltransferase
MATSSVVPYPWQRELPTLDGRLTTLRMPALADAQQLLRVLSDEVTMSYWVGRLITTIDDAKNTIEKSNRSFDDRESFQWAIVQPAQNELIGLCKLSDVNAKHESACVGFVLGQEHWGNGLMSDALHTLFGFAFEHLSLRRLEAFTHPQNLRAHNVLQKQGFAVEGCARERYLGRSGPQDAALLGLLRRQWIGHANLQEET